MFSLKAKRTAKKTAKFIGKVKQKIATLIRHQGSAAKSDIRQSTCSSITVVDESSSAVMLLDCVFKTTRASECTLSCDKWDFEVDDSECTLRDSYVIVDFAGFIDKCFKPGTVIGFDVADDTDNGSAQLGQVQSGFLSSNSPVSIAESDMSFEPHTTDVHEPCFEGFDMDGWSENKDSQPVHENRCANEVDNQSEHEDDWTDDDEDWTDQKNRLVEVSNYVYPVDKLEPKQELCSNDFDAVQDDDSNSSLDSAADTKLAQLAAQIKQHWKIIDSCYQEYNQTKNKKLLNMVIYMELQCNLLSDFTGRQQNRQEVARIM
ncbi:hypothetical protein IWW45_008569 [Coemansia sp. RSA 485]|nr:hypothetical protein IWW45_008569 [Coemansia sp. RSA 485]